MSIALLFPGQGSQYVGMGKKLYSEHAVAREVIDEASCILDLDIKQLCFEGSIEELSQTIVTQQVIYVMGVAAHRVFVEEVGIIPEAIIGNSLGEITALTCANIIDFKDGLKLVKSRASFMEEAERRNNGIMAAVLGLEKEIIEQKCSMVSSNNERAWISNYNAPLQTIISGHKSAVEKVTEELIKLGASTKLLKVSGAFHTEIMYSAAYKFQEELKKYTYNEITIPVVSNITAKPYRDKAEIIKNLSFQIIRPVQWVKTIKYLEHIGVVNAIEMGPGSVLKNLMKHNTKKIKAYSLDEDNDFDEVKAMKNRGISYINCNCVDLCLSAAVCCKNNNTDKQAYAKAIENYNMINKIVTVINEENRLPNEEEITRALNSLNNIFDIKLVDKKEKLKVLNEIITKSGVFWKKELSQRINII